MYKSGDGGGIALVHVSVSPFFLKLTDMELSNI